RAAGWGAAARGSVRRTPVVLGAALVVALASGACEAGAPASERPARAEPGDTAAAARPALGDAPDHGEAPSATRPGDDDTRPAVDAPGDGGLRDGAAGAASTSGAGGAPEVDADPAAAANAVASGVTGSGVQPAV